MGTRDVEKVEGIGVCILVGPSVVVSLSIVEGDLTKVPDIEVTTGVCGVPCVAKKEVMNKEFGM